MGSFERTVGPVTLYIEYDRDGQFTVQLTDDGPDIYGIGLLSATLETELFCEVNRRV